MVNETKTKIEFALKNYWKPTPKIMRAIGDSIQYGVGIMTAYYVGAKLNSDAWIVIVLAMIGKFVTNMAIEKEVKQ